MNKKDKGNNPRGRQMAAPFQIDNMSYPTYTIDIEYDADGDDMEIEFYRTEDGAEPAREFLDTLDSKMLAKMLRTIDLLEKNGAALRRPYSAPLGDGIFELRAQQGSDITRVLYFFQIGDKAYLTHGFTKKTQKTPRAEIEQARKYREDHLRRFPNE